MNVGRYIRGGKIICKYSINKILSDLSITHPPAFIVGCGHSGTSIILRVVGNHPNIYAVKHESKMALGDKSDFLHQKRKFDITAISEGYSRWIEKTPRHIRTLGNILNWSKNSKIILVVRDGRDVACSIRDRYGDIKIGIERWVEDNKKGQRYWNDPNVHVVKYESFVKKTRETTKELIHFIEEEFKKEITNYHEENKSFYAEDIEKPEDVSNNHAKYRNWQINQPIFDGSGKWKKEMSNEEKSIVKEIGGDMLIEYGYAEGYEW